MNEPAGLPQVTVFSLGGTIESYSSRGPATLLFPAAVRRQKPEVSGIDGVSITGAGGFANPFYGTSASAPAVAAVSALVWSGSPNSTASQVRAALLSSCTDLGVPGPDTTFGDGRVDAVAFAQALGLEPALSVTSITPNMSAQGSTVAITSLFGRGFRDGATVRLLRPNATGIEATNVTVISSSTITCQFALPSTAAPGAWDVVVTDPDNRSASLTGGFTITPPPPIAAFSAAPVSGTAPLVVWFTDASDGESISWAWAFGDGDTSTLQHPTHVFVEAGTYTVVLNVSNTGGSDIQVRTDYITVTAPARTIVPLPGGFGLPLDPGGDGLYEDVNGNGRNDFADVVLYFDRMTWIAANEPVAAFDYNGNTRIDFADVVWLFNHL